MVKPGISIVGAGYVGLCTALGFASKNFQVVAVDTNEGKIANLSNGVPTFHEPELKERLFETLARGKIKFLSNTQEAVLQTEFTFVTVGTPCNTDGSIDLKYIESAAKDIGRALKQKQHHHVVIIKSTVIPGTTQNVVKPIVEEEAGKKCGEDWGLCMNPEFLRQGCAFEDTIRSDRLVIGSFDARSGDVLEDLYFDFYDGSAPPIIRTTLGTAELIKYASNSLLATKISFINMIANICEKVPGADVKVVAQAMGLDKRIGPFFLDAGIGYGGSCFPKDVKALIACSKKLGYNPQILELVELVNQEQPLRAVELCEKLIGSLRDKQIAILGLAFKPDTDDMREARVIPIINRLLELGAKVNAYDPVAIPVAKSIYQTKIRYSYSALDCLKNADCAILVTEWPEFRNLNPQDFINNMTEPALVDGRRIYDLASFSEKIKFATIGVGSR